MNEKNFNIVPVAASGFEKGYLESIRITWDDSPEGNGPSGRAIKTRKPNIMRNLVDDPTFKPWICQNPQILFIFSYKSIINLFNPCKLK